MEINFKFSVNLFLYGDITKGEITCPSPPAIRERRDDKVEVKLEKALLDRDFVLLIKGSSTSYALCMQDKERWMAGANFAVSMPEAERSPIALKILIDCSESMNGDSISQARIGLKKAISCLEPHDLVSYSRFGSKVWHMSQQLVSASAENLGKYFQAVDNTNADMGGTKMGYTLNSTFRLRSNTEGLPPMLLLITDGDIWDIENIVNNAQKSGHRIFAIGVGSTPAESLLRKMAEMTGGACEFVIPTEDMAAAIVRMFHRMRGSITNNVHVDWGQKPVWQSQLPQYIYDGETIHAFALLPEKPENTFKLCWDGAGNEYAVETKAEECDIPAFLKLAKIRQMESASSKNEKLAIALEYELVSDVTALFLMHEREDKIMGAPRVMQVPQMPAYGHGNYLRSSGPSPSCVSLSFEESYEIPCFIRTQKDASRTPRHYREEKPPFIRTKAKYSEKRSGRRPPARNKDELIREFLYIWNKSLFKTENMYEFMMEMNERTDLDEIWTFLVNLSERLNMGVYPVWAAFVDWCFRHAGIEIDRHSQRRLAMDPMPDNKKAEVEKNFQDWFEK